MQEIKKSIVKAVRKVGCARGRMPRSVETVAPEVLPVYEVSRVSDRLEWPKLPETDEIEKMTELVAAKGYYTLEDLLDTSMAERDRQYILL